MNDTLEVFKVKGFCKIKSKKIPSHPGRNPNASNQEQSNHEY
jgi:hypothetical protein